MHIYKRSGMLFILALLLAAAAGGVVSAQGVSAGEVYIDPDAYERPDDETLRSLLTNLEYRVTQEDATEPPFHNEYWRHYEAGIYVDIVTGEPLFSSLDKFSSPSGWPSFAQAIVPEVIVYRVDTSHGMVRREVRSRVGDSHLGHVFEDGPQELGGMRYCINSAALRFVSLADMEDEGYGFLLPLFSQD